jgi:hypothetical protein
VDALLEEAEMTYVRRAPVFEGGEQGGAAEEVCRLQFDLLEEKRQGEVAERLRNEAAPHQKGPLCLLVDLPLAYNLLDDGEEKFRGQQRGGGFELSKERV